MWGDNISTMGDNISTVEGIQYSGGRILISTCLVINNDEKISTFLYYDTKFSFGSFSKIQADFMHFESWTGVLQVQPCFELIYNVIFGVIYLSFKFNCLVTARDIYSLLILSNQLQIHENAIKIGLNLKQGFKCAKCPIVLGS